MLILEKLYVFFIIYIKILGASVAWVGKKAHIFNPVTPATNDYGNVRRPCVNLRWMLSVTDRRRETQEQIASS